MIYKINEMLEYSFLMKHKDEIRRTFQKNELLIEKKIAILCGGTFGVIKDFFEIMLLYQGIKPIFFEGEYNRFYEEACFENKDLKNFGPDFILIHTTNKNLISEINETSIENLEQDKKRYLEVWENLKKEYHAVIIQNNFEFFEFRMIGNAARTFDNGNVRYIDSMNSYMTSYAKDNRMFFVNDINFLSAYIGLTHWYDERMWNLYKYPMSMTATPYYALSISNIIKSVSGKNKKTIICDLDNTLWGGVIGEDGVENIVIGRETAKGEAYEQLQRYLNYLGRNGAILGICSKNDYEKGISGLQSKKSYLKKEDFAAIKINWEDKSSNVKEMLKEINIVEESAVFIDDQPVECDSIRSLNPGVSIIQATKPYETIREFERNGFFEMTFYSQEDKDRKKYYQDNIKRNELQGHFTNYNDYLKSLNMICYAEEINTNNIERVVQLLNKTNQFNFLTHRYTSEELLSICKDGCVKSFVLELQDKFGSNGIVSVGIVRNMYKDVYIDDWVMSCRVFGRGLEYLMLQQMVKLCKNADGVGEKTLHGYYRNTPKNGKIKDFYDQLGFVKVNEETKTETEEWICNNVEALEKKFKNLNIELV